ncbi:MAG: hypothetical protein K6F49_01715 [Saccharofermentans sp.]|nr:hypothetical protein [Saccharofermentans sp.]
MSYDNDKKSDAQKVVMLLSLLLLLPFIAVGVSMIVKGIRGIASGSSSGAVTLIFGIMWSISLSFTIVYMRKAFLRIPGQMEKYDPEKHDPNLNTGEYIPPEKDPRFDYEWMKHDDCEADHDDDEDSVRKGYE